MREGTEESEHEVKVSGTHLNKEELELEMDLDFGHRRHKAGPTENAEKPDGHTRADRGAERQISEYYCATIPVQSAVQSHELFPVQPGSWRSKRPDRRHESCNGAFK